ncbi:MAG: diguanylate cyclase [Terracidiphilus sp.]
MLLSQDELVSALFCDTDRAQRLKMPLSLIAVGFTEMDRPEGELEHAGYDGVERSVVGRITGILRWYDSVGKWADGEFLLSLPGCTGVYAKTLAERLRDEVFAAPVQAGGGKLCVKACFGVASSGGRSPFVVLRDARDALHEARAAGPGSIRCMAADTENDPNAFLIPVLGREDLHW